MPLTWTQNSRSSLCSGNDGGSGGWQGGVHIYFVWGVIFQADKHRGMQIHQTLNLAILQNQIKPSFRLQGFWLNLQPLESSQVAQRWRIHLQSRRRGFDPWVEMTPWKRKWQPFPAFVPGKSYGQRSLMDYCPRSHKKSETTKRLSAHACTHTHTHTHTVTGRVTYQTFFFPFLPAKITSSCVAELLFLSLELVGADQLLWVSANHTARKKVIEGMAFACFPLRNSP